MYLETRDQNNQRAIIQRLKLSSLELQEVDISIAWWHKLLAAKGGLLYMVEYADKDDPTKQSLFCIDVENAQRKEVTILPDVMPGILEPQLYEHGGKHHKTVSDFLGAQLPLSCEYMEWEEKIIISYYLRSDIGFDRYLLLLNEGKKVWKMLQDGQMKGFSPGAFFVFNHQLIFIKDRHEICVYAA